MSFQTFKTGKLPARKDAISLKFANYATLAQAPAKAGHYSLVPNWDGMLGNDQYGDCVWAGGDHETVLWNKTAGSTVTFTAANALADYAACTGFNPKDPNTDQGTDMQKAAAYRQKVGLIDAQGKRHTVGAYAAITAGNLQELKQAIAIFGVVGVGIEFPSSAMQQFNAGQPWSVMAHSSIEGGHYVPAVGYDNKYIYVVTWGKVQKMTYGFFSKYCDEALVYISNEALAAHANNPDAVTIDGFDLKTLTADLAQLK